jgi:orotate phosphoribosyltransferase
MPDILQILKEVDALIQSSHLVYTSGKHGSVYINKDALYPHISKVSAVGKMMAELYTQKDIDVVIGPALGGIILSQWVAHHLSALQGKEIQAVYAEKDNRKNLIFTRGYDKLIKGKNVLIVEDITNTGGSTKKVIKSAQEAGATVVAACVMVNRDPTGVTTETMGVPFDALGVIEAEAYEEADCPLCKEGVPVNTEVGHGKKFLESKV